jgi:tRNA(Ile)-lysidine synthase
MLATAGRAGQKLELAHGLRAERTHRELRMTLGPVTSATEAQTEYAVAVPGEMDAPGFGLRLRVSLVPADSGAKTATLRTWKPGDRVTVRHSSGPRKVKEVLERMKVTGSGRVAWPVLELDGRIVWMKGIELEPEPGLRIDVASLD